MIRSNLPELKLTKERALNHKLTYEMLKAEVGVSQNVLARLLSYNKPVRRIDASSIEKLCRYFNCSVGDLLEYVADANEVEKKSV